MDGVFAREWERGGLQDARHQLDSDNEEGELFYCDSRGPDCENAVGNEAEDL